MQNECEQEHCVPLEEHNSLVPFVCRLFFKHYILYCFKMISEDFHGEKTHNRSKIIALLLVAGYIKISQFAIHFCLLTDMVVVVIRY